MINSRYGYFDVIMSVKFALYQFSLLWGMIKTNLKLQAVKNCSKIDFLFEGLIKIDFSKLYAIRSLK